jgi:hypothetical protein
MSFLPELDLPGAARTSPAELSIVFVNWNSADYLRECITSIYTHTKDVQFELIVVDNASPQRGVDGLKEQFPGTILIKSPENLGFARANNLGFKHCSGRYVLFLNPDTQLVGPAIQVLLNHLKSLSQVGIVGCKLLNSDLSVHTSSIQKFPTILGQVTDIEYIRLRWPNCKLWGIAPVFAECAAPTKVEVIPGACMMMKREVFERVGGFSEEYFMYGEDLDLCYKVVHAGFVNYYVGSAAVIHHGGKSSGRREVNQWATGMKFTSILRFVRKSRGRFYGASFRLVVGFVALIRLLVIALAFPFIDRTTRQFVISKWWAIFNWAVGADKQSKRVITND